MGPPFYVVCEPREGLAACSSAKGVPLFLSYFKTLSIGLVPGIEPATSRSAFPAHSSDQANTAMVEIAHFGVHCFATARNLLEIKYPMNEVFKWPKNYGTRDLPPNFCVFLFLNTPNAPYNE